MAHQAASEGSNYDPASTNFYAVCVNKCPIVGQWLCDRHGITSLADHEETVEKQTKLDICVSKTFAKGGAFLSKDPGLLNDENCQSLLSHCWKTDSDQKSIFYRCMPLNNITTASESDCMYPSSSIKDTDERCSKKRVISTTITEQPAKENLLFKQLNSMFATVMRYFGDVQKSMHIILLTGGGGALVTGLCWLIALRYMAGCMVWTSLIFVIILAITCTCFCFSKAGLIGASDLERMTGTSPAASTYLLADDDNKNAWKYVSYGCAVITIIMLVIIVAIKNKVNIAIGIVKETSKAVHDMKMMMLYPLITTSLLICLMVWWLIVAAYIISSDGLTLNNIKGSGALDYNSPFGSSPTKDSLSLLNATEICQQGLSSSATLHCVYNSTHNVTVGQYLLIGGDWNVTATEETELLKQGGEEFISINVSNTNSTGGAFGLDGNANAMRYIMLYHFFGLLWTNQLIQGVAIMVLSGSFSRWYFAGPHDAEDDTDRPEDYEERTSAPVLKSCCRTVRYHLGTVMFGGFIIATVQFARAILAYLDENTKSWQEGNTVSWVVVQLFFFFSPNLLKFMLNFFFKIEWIQEWIHFFIFSHFFSIFFHFVFLFPAS